VIFKIGVRTREKPSERPGLLARGDYDRAFLAAAQPFVINFGENSLHVILHARAKSQIKAQVNCWAFPLGGVRYPFDYCYISCGFGRSKMFR
jgi:hypothetical protein